MKIRTVALSVAAVSIGCWALASSARAQDHHLGSLIDEVRSAIQQFADVRTATAAGYAPFLGCVSGPEEGAMGIHYVNGSLVADGEVDVGHPEALIYEPKNGQFQLVAVEYIVIADQWNAAHPSPPTLAGQVFHYIGSPNRYGTPALYELHVWAAKNNPHGAFADWNPVVSCEDYKP